jgi:hypothetical protein
MPVATDFDLTNAGFSGGTIIRDRDDSKKVVFKGISVTALGSGKIIIVKASALSAKAASASVTAQKMLAWTKAGSHPFGSSNIRGIAYGNNKYVAVGAGKIATSVDGTTWTESPSPSSDGWAVADNYVDFQGIVFGNGKFIAVGYWLPKENNGNNGWGVAATSTDGTTWIVKDKILTVNDDSAQIYAIAWTGTTFVAVGRWGRSAVSPDGNVWTTQQVDGFDSWGSDWQDVYAVAADGTGKVVAGGANGKLSYSSDYGVTWTWAANYFFGEDRAIKTILLTGNTFIAAGEGGNMKVISANLIPGTGGDDWQGVNSKFETTHIWSLAAGGGRIIAVGDNGKMSESTDGFGWTALGEGEGPGQSGFTIEEQIACVVYGNGKFIIGGNAYNDQGNAGKIAYSNQ